MAEHEDIVEAVVAPDEVELKEASEEVETTEEVAQKSDEEEVVETKSDGESSDKSEASEDEKSIRARANALMEQARALLAELGPAEEEEDMAEEADEKAEIEEGEAPKPADPREELIAELSPVEMTPRQRRLSAMGVKDLQGAEESFMCAIDRTIKSAGSDVCDACVGGCVREKGLPDILDIEAQAEVSYKGNVLESGYSANDDLFVVDLERESDGKVIEAFFKGDGEELGYLVLNQDLIGEKSEIAGTTVIGIEQAEKVALSHVQGESLGVDADFFEGQDAYVVEIDSTEGKSYDVYVALDGEFLGYDEYDLEDEESEDEKAEQAEMELKRAFPMERREELAKEGMAMPDGSFPIVTVADLKNAIMAYGRAKDKPAAKRHIMKRARALDAWDQIPDDWKGGEKVLVGDQEDGEFMAKLMEFEMMKARSETEKRETK